MFVYDTPEGVGEAAHALVLDHSRIGKLLASSKMAALTSF